MTLRRASQHLCLLVAGLLAAGVAGCRAAKPEEDEHPQAPVQAEAAKKLVLGEWTDLFGVTQPLPNHSARISATLEGHVIAVLGDGKGSTVREGQQVKPGQVIVQLDDSVVRANRDKLKATLKDLEEQHKQAEFALQLATIDVDRLKGLQQKTPGGFSMVSTVELEKCELLQKDARSKLLSATAKEAAARADVKALDKQLEFFALRAPIAGRLGIVQAVPGQTLTPGTIVADVVDLDPIDVLCYAPPSVAARLALDQPAKLVLEESFNRESQASAQQPLTGKVAFIAVQAQPETGNIPVKVRFPNPNLQVRAHAVARVYVLTQPEKERLTLPETAVMEDVDIPSVIAIQDLKTEKKDKEEETTGKARRLQVALGVRDRERGVVEILQLEDPATKKTLSADGLLFVTAGGHGLQNDDAVKIEKEKKEE